MKDEFFDVRSVAECTNILLGFQPVQDSEEAFLAQALGRVTAQNVPAAEDLPLHSRSSMDGYAVRAKDSFGAGETNPVYLTITGRLAVDDDPELEIGPGECAQILTGGSLPRGADAVVMVEYTRQIAEDEIEVFRSLGPGDNVMLRGEDCRQGDVVVQAGTRMRPQDLGILAALGMARVEVRRRLRVAILSTGDELVPIQDQPEAGKIRDVNSTTIAAWCAKAGGQPFELGIVRDRQPELKKALEDAAQGYDCIFLSGGSSVGTRDLSLEVISSLPQGRIMAHGIALSPGKPTILAAQGQVPIIGLPGQVTSAQVVMYVLGLPFLSHLSGEGQAFARRGQPRIWATAARNIPSQQGREDYVRVKLDQEEKGGFRAEPVWAKSGLLRSMLHADGLLRIPAQTEGILKGEPGEIWLL